MTTLAPSAVAPTTADRRRMLELGAGWAAVAGTVPYLTLKALWLAGVPAGVDPALLADRSITVLNGVTVALDAVVIALAMALTYRWGRRIPAWLMLLPMWVGVGFLAPMAIAIAPALVLGASGAASPLASWVQPMVYGGFAWQGVFLIVAFVLYARRRWADVAAAPAAVARPVDPLLRVLAGGGTVMAALSAGLLLADGLAAGAATGVMVSAVSAGLAVAGAAGVLALVRGTTARRWLAIAAGFAGSGAMFSWGLWAAVNTMAATALAGGGALPGLARLTGLLGGFALAVAGMLALVGTGVARPRGE